MSELTKKNFSIINFASEIKEYIFNPNQKYIKWGADNDIPTKILHLYDSVPEHEASINFTELNLTGDGLEGEELNIWAFKKVALDYLLFGGYTLKIVKLRNGNYTIDYFDISKCRYSPDKKKIGYSEDWSKYKAEVTWYDAVTNVDQVRGEAIYMFKNNKSRECYPRPNYLSAFRSIDTASEIIDYHNNNAKNGFAVNTIISMNNGVPDPETQEQIEKAIKDKFTGSNSTKFMLMFNDTADNAATVTKLSDDNLDQKFETLQKFVQNQITISHQITSGQLIGVKGENQGFSKTEYQEALEIFKEVVIEGYKLELEYSLSSFLNKEVKIMEDIEEPEDMPEEETDLVPTEPIDPKENNQPNNE